MWQYTSSGSVPGIQGGVDMNECYQDYPKAIKEKGLNGFNKPTPTPAPAPEPAKTADVYYRVRTKADGWLPEVKTLRITRDLPEPSLMSLFVFPLVP